MLSFFQLNRFFLRKIASPFSRNSKFNCFFLGTAQKRKTSPKTFLKKNLFNKVSPLAADIRDKTPVSAAFLPRFSDFHCCLASNNRTLSSLFFLLCTFVLCRRKISDKAGRHDPKFQKIISETPLQLMHY